jgi:Na+-transporting NADH:ubiquinone oxidoreductase subunit NqrC
MAAGRSQDSSSLYAIIIFVALFIVSTVFAVVFYLKNTDMQKTVQDSEKKIEAVANAKELKTLGSLAGKDLPRKSVLGSMLIHFDELTAMVLGSVPENASVGDKLEMSKQKSRMITDQLTDSIGADANSVGLVQALELLKNKYDESKAQQIATNNKLTELGNLFDEEKKAAVEKENEIAAAMQKLQQDANSATGGYESLKAAMQQGSDQQVAAIAARLDLADQTLKKEQQELLLAQAKLKNAESRLDGLQTQLEQIMPKPDNLTTALKPDGKIISIDDASKTVIVNLGSDDRVYRGLTFAVYDKSLPVPRDGKGKANIELFDIKKNVSAARIVWVDKKDSVMADDNIANVIWNSADHKEFVVAGKFAFGDGIDSVKELIRRWGGIVADNVSISTNFLVLGTTPKAAAKPNAEEMEADPRAKEKYEAALQKQQEYNEVITQAKTLSIPVFDLERFLDFIGYTNSTTKK